MRTWPRLRCTFGGIQQLPLLLQKFQGVETCPKVTSPWVKPTRWKNHLQTVNMVSMVYHMYNMVSMIYHMYNMVYMGYNSYGRQSFNSLLTNL
jgi:hypothetical protein